MNIVLSLSNYTAVKYDKIMHRCFNIEHKYVASLVEKVQLMFCKMLLGVHKSAAYNAVRAELRIFPLAIYCLKSSLIIG